MKIKNKVTIKREKEQKLIWNKRAFQHTSTKKICVATAKTKNQKKIKYWTIVPSESSRFSVND